MPGSAEICHLFSKVQILHFEIALWKLLHHHIPHHRRQEIVVIARCGLGNKRVDKCQGITSFAHSGPAAAQYDPRVSVFPDLAHLDVGDRDQKIILDFGGQATIP